MTRAVSATVILATLCLACFGAEAADFLDSPGTGFSPPFFFGGAAPQGQLNYPNAYLNVMQFQPAPGGTAIVNGYVNANDLIATSPAVLSLQNTLRQTQRALAASAALGSASMPSAPGRTTWAVNAAAVQGLGGFSFSFAHRLNASVPLAVTGAYSNGAGSSHIGRVGLMGEF